MIQEKQVRRFGRAILSVGLTIVVLVIAGALLYYRIPFQNGAPESTEASNSNGHSAATADVEEATTAQVHQFCGVCHAYPSPDTFPKEAWKKEVRQGYDFFRYSTLKIDFPPMEGVIKYYENRAPDKLTFTPPENFKGPGPVRFERDALVVAGEVPYPAVSNVNLVHLYDDTKLDLLVCDMRSGKVMVVKPYEKVSEFKVLASIPQPAHAEVVDLDGDGIKDILVANLGSFNPTDARTGSVIWLRGRKDGSFAPPVTLLEGVGRVADVQAAHFRDKSKLDLVVGVFGWRNTGEILFLENQTTDWEHPQFKPHVIDDRHGTIHICVADLNDDKKPDFVALISQEHETIVAFLNKGDGRFDKETIYAAPNPAYGSSGIQLVDMNGDGKVDVLYSNGDTLDPPYMVKPYHSVQWLENKGTYPFEHHPITAMPGCMRAVAADFRGVGVMDVLAVSWLSAENFTQRDDLDSVIFLEQKAPNQFVRHSLEKGSCDHMTCAVGAWNGDKTIHAAIGNFCLSKKLSQPNAVTLWKNRGKP